MIAITAERFGELLDAEARLAAVRDLCDEFAGDIEHSRVHGDGPPEYRAGWQHGVEFAAEQFRAVLAAVDGPTEHRPCPHPELDGYGRCLSCDEPAEGTNGDEGPYTEEQIRETFDRLGDETNQDDFMYNLRWGGPDWSNFMKPRRAAVDDPADHIALFDGPPAEVCECGINAIDGSCCDLSAGSGAGSTQDGDES